MKILRAYKTELDPNNKQQTFFRRCAGISRFIFNWALADRKMQYEKDGTSVNHYEQKRRFNAVKDEQCPWVREVPYAIVDATFVNCNAAFQHFFRRVKNGEKPGYPKFKRKGHRESFQLRHTKVYSDCVQLTRVGIVRLKEANYIPVDAIRYGTYATVSERAGRWFISILVEEETDYMALNGKVLGVDFGLHALAVCSDGKVFENPKPLRDASRRLNRLNRELSRRKQRSSNWRKTKAKLRKAHYKVACVRSHTLHQISYYLTFVARPHIIALEDLNVSGMVQNRRLARAISDAGFGELRRQIEYKAEWAGIEVVYADTFYPSSKTCSNCGMKRDELKLSERTFICLVCGFEIDRDLNAARNLAALVKGETRPDCLGS